ncbi:MAG: Holliday junction resolvase RecU [Turicibacter sp.]|nr:Holliday junction resolvase RecU [Turicibacter sp.]
MAHWNTRGLRGSSFEGLINFTNQSYLQHNLAVIQKVPTPITPVEVNNKERTITKAYFGEKSTVDYIGVVQGIAICFEAKETKYTNFPLKNIHSHQMEFMSSFTKQEGIAFFLINFKQASKIFFLPWEELDIAMKGSGKSIPYSSFNPDFLVHNRDGFPVHYLEAINTYLKLYSKS